MKAALAVVAVAASIAAAITARELDALARMVGVEIEEIDVPLEVRSAHQRVALNRTASGEGLPTAIFSRESWTGRGAVERYRNKRSEAGPLGHRGPYGKNLLAAILALGGYGKRLAGSGYGFVHPSGMARLGYSAMTGDAVPADYPTWAKVAPRRVGPVLIVGEAPRSWI